METYQRKDASDLVKWIHALQQTVLLDIDSPTMHKILDFERKYFVNSRDLIFEETQISTNLQPMHLQHTDVRISEI